MHCCTQVYFAIKIKLISGIIVPTTRGRDGRSSGTNDGCSRRSVRQYFTTPRINERVVAMETRHFAFIGNPREDRDYESASWPMCDDVITVALLQGSRRGRGPSSEGGV